MTRPCTWPDGGCGEPVIVVQSAATGANVRLNPEPEKRIVLVISGEVAGDQVTLAGPIAVSLGRIRTRVVDAYVDHPATCSALAARTERERAARTEVAEPAHPVWGYDWVPEPPEGTTT
jgi:hypothetical protein